MDSDPLASDLLRRLDELAPPGEPPGQDHWEELATPVQRRPLAAVGIVGALAIVLVMIFGLFLPYIREWLVGEADIPNIESIAVLPFENLSGDPEQDYFVDGIVEALINDFANVNALRVISGTSSMRYKNTDKPLPEIARELGAEALVEGSVLRIDERVCGAEGVAAIA